MLSFFETSTFKVVSEAYYKHCPSSKPDAPDPFANCGETWLNDDRFCLSWLPNSYSEYSGFTAAAMTSPEYP